MTDEIFGPHFGWYFDGWYACYRAILEEQYAAAQEAKRAAQVAEINRVLGRIDEMGIEH